MGRRNAPELALAPRAARALLAHITSTFHRRYTGVSFFGDVGNDCGADNPTNYADYYTYYDYDNDYNPTFQTVRYTIDAEGAYYAGLWTKATQALVQAVVRDKRSRSVSGFELISEGACSIAPCH